MAAPSTRITDDRNLKESFRKIYIACLCNRDVSTPRLRAWINLDFYADSVKFATIKMIIYVESTTIDEQIIEMMNKSTHTHIYR